MKKLRLISPFAMLLIASCVTINVYFPAAAAQEAADKIVNEVLKQEALQENAKPQPEARKNNEQKKSTSTYIKPQNRLTFAEKVLDFIIPSAHAGANISIETPKIRSLRNKLKQQHGGLNASFNSGNIGYSDNGLIKIRNTDGLNIRQKSTLNKQVSTANSTLSALYTEIARANGHPEWKSDIQKTFAKTWVNQMQGGWMYFSGGQWKKK